MVRVAFAVLLLAFLAPGTTTACPVLNKIAAMQDRSGLSVLDVSRARQLRPTPGLSAVSGDSAAEAFGKMNMVLENDPVNTISCDAFDHGTLNQLSRILYKLRVEGLDEEYRARSDRRAMHFDELAEKETLWQAEAHAATVMPSHAPGSANWNATRDGKCAEVVMWFVHHLTEGHRAQLATVSEFVLPLMPQDEAPRTVRSAEYDQQIGCTSCHVAVQVPGAPPIAPIPRKNSSDPQFPMTCPNGKDGKPTVWYEEEQGEAGKGKRVKRCDWDYEPFCEPCEGVGGMIWGSGKDDWLAMPCEMVARPEDIPADNLTSPLWPKSFTVSEYASLTFPGRDPCKIGFKNSTYDLQFETTPDGPIYHSIGKTGPSGPSPIPGKSWALPNGNFFNTVDVFGKSAFCICLGALDPIVDNAITGPLSYDFNKGAKLVGREKVQPEYMDNAIVADHWVKGPHHFWIDVATNQMVREWQPFNGLQTYVNWNLTTPEIKLPELCYKGLLHKNISCLYPPPTME